MTIDKGGCPPSPKSDPRVRRLLGKPWGARRKLLDRWKPIYRVKGMLGFEERRSLHWLGRHYYEGSGLIVDAGAFVGASAFCLASGVAAGGRAPAGRPCVYSYDFFRAMDGYVAADIARDFDRPTRIGDSYLDIFQAQTKRYRHLVQAVEGDFLDARWSRGPIEILFIDVAKTEALNSHVIREFFPHLIPGRSLVVQQDFFHCHHPHIHICMELLKDYFDVVDAHIDLSSRLYVYREQIPRSVLDEVADYLYPPARRIDVLDKFIAGESGDLRAMGEVVKLCQLVNDGDERCLPHYDDILAANATKPGALWVKQAHALVYGPDYRPG